MKPNGSTRLIRMMALAGLVTLLAAQSWAQVPAKPAGDDSDQDINSIFLSAPRELRQNLARAQKAIEEEQYAEAVEQLGAILNGETADDYFLGTPGSPDAQTSLKMQALVMLGSMPAKGRQLYELNFGAEARAALNVAMQDASVPQLTEVARRYFHTKAGYEAVILLGRIHLEQGRPLAAALSFQRVASVESAGVLYDPQLSLLLAAGWHYAHQPEKASETLVGLKNRSRGGRLTLGDQQLAFFDQDQQALPWLEKLLGNGGVNKPGLATQWAMFRGNETRNAVSLASLPLLSPRFFVPTVDLPEQPKVRTLSRQRVDRGDPLVPSLQPVVVGDFLVYRSADMVIGADLKSEGLRVWTFPWDQKPSLEQVSVGANQGRGPLANTREQQLAQRIWDDHAFGQMSSDGEQIFAIDELGFAAIANNSSVPRVIAIGGGRFVGNQFWPKPFNKLVSLDVRRQGALNWKVGGESGEDDANLAGVFFLGAPLPLGGQLYVLGEFNGEIRLLCLNSKTGALEWKQSIAMMPEFQAIQTDSLRRLASASPSFADGVLICPTSGGGVVAVDLATRSLRWGYQYPRGDVAVMVRNGFVVPQASRNSPENASPGRWVDSSVTVANGNVLLTPVESNELHCLDLLTGKARWKPIPRGGNLYVACVHQGNAILVGKTEITSVQLANGEAAWKTTVSLEGDSPAGRGYYSDKHYYLPTTSSHLLKIDLEQGAIVARARTNVPLGNLVCYKDELLSQTGDQIASFYMTEPLRKSIEERLAKNPDDFKALAQKGEILLQDGQQDEALALLRRAHQLNDKDSAVREMLARVMLALLRQDFAVHQGLADEAELLLPEGSDLRGEFYHLRAAALEQAGQTLAAFKAYIALGDLATREPADGPLDLQEVARDHLVRRDRWSAARLAALYAKADATVRLSMDELVTARVATARASEGSSSLRDCVLLFGFHPLVADAKIALANRYLAADKPLEMELLLGDLVSSPVPEVAASANGLLAEAYVKAGRLDLAAQRYRLLAGPYADVVSYDVRTGSQKAQAAAEANKDLAKLLSADYWPAGAVESKLQDAQSNAGGFGFGDFRFYVNLVDFRGVAPRGFRALYSQRETAIRVYDAYGKPLSSISLARPGQAQTFYGGSNNVAVGRLNGHLLVVSHLGELLVLDALHAKLTQNTEGVIWRQDLLEMDASGRRAGMFGQPRQRFNPLQGNGRVPPVDARLNGVVGPITSHGIYYVRGKQLLCVEPLTGKVVWERSGIEAGTELFGDEEKLVMIPPKSDASGLASEALILSALDGSIVDRRMVDKADRRWTSCGRNVLAWEQTASTVKLRLYDAANQGAGLWSGEVKLPGKGCIIESEELALLDPSGKFTIVSLRDGKVLLSADIAPETDLQSIHVLRSPDQYILLPSISVTEAAPGVTIMPLSTGGQAGSPVNGRVYAFDRATGKAQWQTPAFISQHGLPQDQPERSPFLVFVRNKNETRGGAGAARNTTSLLVLDRRDGSVVFSDDAFLSQAMYCDIVADPGKQAVSVSIAGNQSVRTVTLTLTETPAPPRPPLQTGEMSSLTLGETPGTAVDVATDIFKALNRGQQEINPRVRPFGRIPVPAPGAGPNPLPR